MIHQWGANIAIPEQQDKHNPEKGFFPQAAALTVVLLIPLLP
jgi:hypothetical protein